MTTACETWTRGKSPRSMTWCLVAGEWRVCALSTPVPDFAHRHRSFSAGYAPGAHR
jgi:hypothetical protein